MRQHPLQNATHHRPAHLGRPVQPGQHALRSDGGPDDLAAPAATSVAAVILRWSGGRPVVGLSGEVDVSTAAQLRSVAALLERHGHRAAVDASGVTFLDAAGLHALVELAGPGGSLLVLRPSPAVLRLLDLLELSGVGPAVLRAGPREEAVVLRETAAVTVPRPSRDRPTGG
ncbi:STAS domain-containing protein [Quadrisphaera setariae]|uniref:STAS domain-containing protein n=1 Tax=Quadrisphaera setariae TaxID=2593304 RepID=UPI001C9C8FF5|nr:STAS domain-containing protein [Quadrisphaera setariae]